MKPHLAAAVLITLSLTQPVKAQVLKDCELRAMVAAKAMESRQYGVSLSTLMEINNQAEGMSGPDKELMNGLAMLAYDQKLWRSEASKQEAITEFENIVLLNCLKHEQDEN